MGDINLQFIFKVLDMLPIGIVIIDGNDFVQYINTYGENISFYKKEMVPFIKFKEVSSFLYKKDKNRFEDEWINSEGKKYRLNSKNINENTLLIIEDVTENEDLRRENNLIKTVFDAINEGIQITNEKGETVLYNWACEKYEGMSREDVLGKKITEVYNVTKDNSAHHNVFKSGKPIIEKNYEYFTRNGKKVDVIASVYPYFEKNKVTAVYSVNRDVTKMKDFINKSIELQKKLMYLTKNEKDKRNGTNYSFEDIVGEDINFKSTVEVAKRIAKGYSSIMIYGETGTGKELFAQSIHNGSLFSKGPFIPINCAAIPEGLLESLLFGTVKGAFTGAVESIGLFEQAKDGTIYLDEINSMSMNLQAKLLRVIQEKKVKRIGDFIERNINCRVISSTNKDPIDAMKNKEIRQDLYYRLSAVTLYIPSLKERKEDIFPLINFFLKKYNKLFGTSVEELSEELKKAYINYNWPGNVRELEHAIEGALNIVNSSEKVLKVEHLSIYLRKNLLGDFNKFHYISDVGDGSLCEILDGYEKKILCKTLKENNYNISQTATKLGIYRQALQYRIKRFGINIDNLRCND